MQRGLNVIVNIFILFFAHGLLFKRYPMEWLYPSLLLMMIPFISFDYGINYIKKFKYYLLIFFISVLIGIHDRDDNFLRDLIKLLGNYVIFPAFILLSKNRSDTIMFWRNVVYIIIPIQVFQYFSPSYSATLSGISVDIFRYSGPFVNPNITAMVVLGGFLFQDRLNLRLSILSFISIALTESRSFLAAFLLLLFIRSSMKFKIILLMLGVIFIFNYWSVLEDSRLFSVFGDSAFENIERSRLVLWATTLSVILQKPFIGHGYGSMDYVVDFIGTGLGPHNFFLFVWGSGGIICLFLLMIEVRLRVNNIFREKFGAFVFIMTVLMFNHDMLLLLIYPLMLSVYDKKIMDSY